MLIRPFQPADAELLLVIFRKNVPNAFGEDGVAEYAHFLKTHNDPYFVAEHEGRVVGACGYSVRPDRQPPASSGFLPTLPPKEWALVVRWFAIRSAPSRPGRVEND